METFCLIFSNISIYKIRFPFLFSQLTNLSYIFLWHSLIEYCQACYNSGTKVTVNDQLFPRKCWCLSTQFILDKPDKYVFKFRLVMDFNSKYALNEFLWFVELEDKPSSWTMWSWPWWDFFYIKGMNLMTDNYFKLKKLFKRLKKAGIFLFGT